MSYDRVSWLEFCSSKRTSWRVANSTIRGKSVTATANGPQTHVLVVEDEILLRMRAVDIVEDAGFTAIEAVNADDALEILESRSDISLLLSDIQMPGSLDGLKLAHAVHDRWPGIKIILVSGQIRPSETDKPADSRFFPKPVNRRGTGDRVRRANGDRGLLSCGDQGSARRSWSGLRSRAEPGSRPGWWSAIVRRGF